MPDRRRGSSRRRFPAFAQARERARSVSCLSNVKMIGYAALAYVQDHDDSFPMSVYPLDGADEEGHIVLGSDSRVATAFDALLPYLRSSDVLLCPEYPYGGGGIDYEALLNDMGLRGSGGVRHAAYSWNFALFQDPAAGPVFDAEDPVLGLSSVPEPASTTLFYDARTFEASITTDPPLSTDSGTAGLRTYGEPISETGPPGDGGGEGELPEGNNRPPFDWYSMPGHARHGGGLNIGFVDGHVRWFKEDASVPGDSPSSPTDPVLVPTYTIPWDLSGIPGGEKNT